jgi:hypothetical protein
VKFAEAKNAALLAFCSAWTVAIGNAISKPSECPASYVGILPMAAALFMLAAIIAFSSFLPRMNLGKFFRGEDRLSRPLNLIFYGDIKGIPIGDFASRIEARYLPTKGQTATADYLEDLACQIHVNSSIADRKFLTFKIATWPVLAGIALLAWPAIRWALSASVSALVGAA